MRNYYIYKHTNPENGKVYIGHTTNIDKRWKNGLGYKYNKPMFEDILRYGWDNFNHEILEQTNSKAAASALENEYILKYDATNPQKGYNHLIMNDVKDSKLNNKHSIPVFQYDIEGNYITEFPSAAEADRQTGVNYSLISLCCNGKRKQAGNYQWSFEKQNKIPGTFFGRKYPTPTERESTRKTKIQMFSADGVLLGEYKSAIDAERKTDISVSFIRTSCAGGFKKPKKVYFKKVPIISENC